MWPNRWRVHAEVLRVNYFGEDTIEPGCATSVVRSRRVMSRSLESRFSRTSSG